MIGFAIVALAVGIDVLGVRHIRLMKCSTSKPLHMKSV